MAHWCVFKLHLPAPRPPTVGTGIALGHALPGPEDPQPIPPALEQARVVAVFEARPPPEAPEELPEPIRGMAWYFIVVRLEAETCEGLAKVAQTLHDVAEPLIVGFGADEVFLAWREYETRGRRLDA